MSEETKKSHAVIRTYAADLDSERERRNMPSKPLRSTSDTASKKESAPMVSKTKKYKAEAVFIGDKEPEKNVRRTKPVDTPRIIPRKDAEIPKVADLVTKIPAFHELNKHEPLIKGEGDKAKKEVRKPLSKKKGVEKKESARVNIGFDATVITDTKSNSFKLIPSVIKSIKSWFKSLTKKSKGKKATQYIVPETSRRKGVIQKATSKTGTIFSEDNDSLKEKIRMRQQKDSGTHESESSWSPYTETGYDLLESPSAAQNVAVEFKRSGQPVEEPEENDLDILAESRWAASHEEPAKPTPEPVHQPETPREIPYESTEVAKVKEKISEIEILEPVSENTEASKDVETKMVSSKKKNTLSLLNFGTNTLTVLIAIMIVGFLIIIFTANVIVERLTTESETVLKETRLEAVLQNSELLSISVSRENLDRIPQIIYSTLESAPPGIVELPIISQIGDEITPSYLFEVLNFQTVSTLNQSLTVARFISFNKSEPVLMLKFVDEDTVYGGLLSWENTMFSDLSFLHKLTEPSGAGFIDDSIGGYDVRVLKNEDSVVLIYGIVGDNTALVGTSAVALEQIIELGLSN